MASPPDRSARLGRALAASALALALCAGAAACGSDGGSEATAGATTAPQGDFRDEVQGLQRDDPIQVGDIELPEVAADGSTTPFALRAEPGELLFVAFGYTNCPDVCPTTLTDVRTAKGLLTPEESDRVAVAFGTVDPARDTPEVMSAYLGSFVEGGHPLRTEDPAELQAAEDALAITSSVVTEPDGTVEVAHSAKSFVVDDQGDVVVEWAFGTGGEAMASDLRLLLDGAR